MTSINSGIGDKIHVCNINSVISDVTPHVTYEFIIILIIITIIVWLLKPPCFAVWIVIMGSYLVVSVLLGLISIVAFGIFFSILYLIDRSLSVNMETPGFHKNNCNRKDKNDKNKDDKEDKK